MSDVKQKVINIVLGRGSEPISETVTITENQFVATVPVSLSIDQVKLKIDEWVAESTPELEEPLATNLADSMELFSGGVVPEGTFYLVGEQPSDHVLPNHLKPKIKFRTYGAGGKYLLPQLSESSLVAYAFTDAHRMPQIVL